MLGRLLVKVACLQERPTAANPCVKRLPTIQTLRFIRALCLVARPKIESIRLFLFVARTIGLLDQQETSPLIETASPYIALESPKVEVRKRALGDLQQPCADPALLPAWERVQLVDPIVAESNDAGHLGTIERAPELARHEQSLSEEPSIFLWRMTTGKPGQSFIEGEPVHLRRDIHID